MVGNERDRGSELYKNRIGVDSALQYASTKGAVMYHDDGPKLDSAISGNRSQNAKSSLAMMTENFDHIAAPNSIIATDKPTDSQEVKDAPAIGG